jgi:hypothetical protein
VVVPVINKHGVLTDKGEHHAPVIRGSIMITESNGNRMPGGFLRGAPTSSIQ